jgi:hypothetical protein
MVGFVQRLRLAFPQQHRLVDIDDGYVDPEVACHVVEHLERIGASGVILEEQTRPRRCGHVTGKHILPIEEYLEKLNLVLQTRSELVLVARTDVTEESEILRRAEMLAATDADVLLVDGVRKQGAGHFPMLPASRNSRLPACRQGQVIGTVQVLGPNVLGPNGESPFGPNHLRACVCHVGEHVADPLLQKRV